MPTVAIITIQYVATLLQWSLRTLDVASTSPQTRDAHPGLYSVHPRESRDQGKLLWMVLTTTYYIGCHEQQPYDLSLITLKSKGHKLVIAKIMPDAVRV